MRSRHMMLLCASLAACADGPVGPTAVIPPGEPALVQVVAGAAQTDTVGQELPQAISVRVLDANSKPVPGQILNFVVTEGGGQVFAGAALTNDSGLALERWTLGTTAGNQTLEARAVDQQTGQPIVYASITATAVPDRPATFDLALDDTTLFVADTLDLTQLAWTAADRYGNTVGSTPLAISVTGWQQAASRVWADGETRGLVRIQAGMALDSLRLLAIRDLRPSTWTAAYACYDAGPFVKDNRNVMVDSMFVALASDSVVYDGMRARFYFTGTFERWWEDGDYEAGPATRAQWATQAPDSLNYSPGGWAAQTVPGRYDGGNWCGTGARLTFDPVVLLEG